MNSIARKNFLLSFLICLIRPALFGQSIEIDSLTIQLQTSKDTNEVILLNQLAFEYWSYDVDIGHNYALDALNKSTNLNFTKGIAWSKTNLGLYHHFNGEYEKALEF